MHMFVEHIDDLPTFTAKLGSENFGPPLRID